MSKNERITENIVRSLLQDLNYYDENSPVVVEEQKSQIASINKLLRNASKTGKGGKGSPEFIISSPVIPDFLIVFECKADKKHHQSKELNNAKDYAVDGAIHYASFLSKEYNVVAVGVSGQTNSELKISSYIYPKKSTSPKILSNKSGKPIEGIVPFDDFIEHGTYDPDVTKERFHDLMSFSKVLHEFMRDHAKLTESEKPLLVSGTLIALRNKPFANSYSDYDPSALQKQWMHVIKEEIEKADIPYSKKNNMTQPYSSISVHPELGKPTAAYPKGVLSELIHMLNSKVWPFISIYHDFDVVGQFYGEFLKYTGGDKKALGIVLTPRHITELFACIANLDKSSRVLDFCCGTAGFLVSAMHHMIKDASTEAEITNIKKEGLIGVEQQPNMYALAASNMILRGDGKANLYQGSCFDLLNELKQHKCNVGMINPPYAQSDEALHELVFIRDMLNCLEPGGIGIAIVPVARATSPHPAKEELLKHHTLDAVMSMPDLLFDPVGTIPCIMVFKAHQPHAKTNQKTWFGFWKDDGFVKTKQHGRIDQKEQWADIRDSWVDAYRNRDEVAGECVKRTVTHDDEWVAEAYMETDYSDISKDEFEKTVKDYFVFKILN